MQVLDDNGNDVTEQYLILSRRNVRQFVEGIAKYDADTANHFSTPRSRLFRSTRSAGRKDAVTTLNLDKMEI